VASADGGLYVYQVCCLAYGALSSTLVCGLAAQVAVLVATAEGILYEYAIRGLRAPNGPSCALEQESFLLRADS